MRKCVPPSIVFQIFLLLTALFTYVYTNNSYTREYTFGCKLDHGGMSFHLWYFPTSIHLTRILFPLFSFIHPLILYYYVFNILSSVSLSFLPHSHLQFDSHAFTQIQVYNIPLAFPPLSHLSSVLRFHLRSSYDLIFSSLSHIQF